MNNRLTILKKIDELQEKHCLTCTIVDRGKTDNKYCIKKCNIGAELKKLGDLLLAKSNEKVSEILKKGRDMTYSEINYLLGKGITKMEIAREMGFSNNMFYDYLKQMEEGINMKQVDRVEKLVNEGLTKKEIAEKLKIKENTVDYYLTQIKKRDEGKSVTVNDSKLKKELNALRLNYNAIEKENGDLKDEIKELESENKLLEAELNELEGRLQRRIEKLEELNSQLRLRNAELIDEFRESLAELENQYKVEKTKREALFTYITIDSEV